MPTPTFSGASFQINPDNGAYCQSPAVATLTDGRIATVYRNGGDGLDGSLRYVINNADGTVAFEQAIVDTNDAVSVDNEMVDMVGLPGGGFVVVWSERDGTNQNIYHQVFDADGEKVGGKIHTNADMPNGNAQRPDIVGDGKGGFYIAWDDMHFNNGSAQTRSVRLQHFDEKGQPTGASERISDDVGADSNASIAISRDGSRVNVIWDDNLGPSGNNTDGIYGIEFGGKGEIYRADKGEYSEFHGDPDVAYSTGTTFMTVWNEYRGIGQGYAVFGSINGGEEFQINTMAHDHSNTIQKVVGLRDGNFLVVWTDNGFDGNDDVNGQLFSMTGERIGEEFRISEGKSSFINRITAAETIDGQVVVTWDTPDGDILGRTVDTRQGALTWTGGAGNEQVTGTAFADTLDGGAGDDILQGGAGGDTLNGGNGNDTASYAMASAGVTANLAKAVRNTGEAAGDAFIAMENLTGSEFADTLVGDGKANILRGRGGNDRLEGGGGGDYLVGGAGKDVFVFRNTDDSSKKTGVDVVTDFTRKQDRIDLGGTDANENQRRDQDFDFIGTKKFGRDEGELRYEFRKGDTYIHGDTDGDGKADFTLVLDGQVKLTAGMFEL